MQSAVDSGCRRYIRATKVMRPFPKALRLVEKREDKAPCEDSSATKCALAGTQFSNALLSRAAEHDVLLYIKTAAGHSRGQKHSTACNGQAFHSCAASLLDELRFLQSAVCQKHPNEFRCFSAGRDFADKDLLAGAEENIFEHSEVSLFRPGSQKKMTSSSRQSLHSARCPCS